MTKSIEDDVSTERLVKKDETSGQFLTGNKSSTGRPKGARNRLQTDFMVALQEHFRERGKAAIEIAFRESPISYLKLIASLMPREFIVEDGRVELLGDDEIDNYLAEIRRLRSIGIGQNRILTIDGTAKAEEPSTIEG
jgi:hypothetical protein